MLFSCDMSNSLKLIISILIPLAIGFSGSFFTVTGIGSWYQGINKPAWNPPNWIFGPVWTTLYILMGIALYMVWKPGIMDRPHKIAFLLFGAQLILNFFWSIIFFGQHKIGWAFIEIIILWLMILLTIFSFAQVNKLAAWLLVPYISWVSFAAILNYTIWKINS
ncbi:MAG TPA: tryptophan-rich sensory protein [Chitinophagaceae bacterium]|nr:tryptophan-rich sensory protein [Chitinophagaceae bacterium]